MQKAFEYLEHTADLKFRAYGKTLDECFENASKAMFFYMIDLSKVSSNRGTESVFDISADSPDLLLHDYLSEILYRFETEGSVFKEFHVSISREKERYVLHARLLGEAFDKKKDLVLADIKAVTYHDLFVGRKDGLYVAEVLCDT